MTEENNQQQADQTALLSEFNNVLSGSIELLKKRKDESVSFTDVLISLSGELEVFIDKSKSMTASINESGESAKKSNDSIGSFRKGISKLSEKLTAFGSNTGTVFKSFSQVVVKYLDVIAKHPLIAIFVQVYKVIEKVFSAIKTLGTVMFSVFSQSLKYGTRFAKFMVSLPLKIAGAAAKIGNSLREDLIMTIGSAIESTKEMFDISEKYGSGAGSAIKSFAESSKDSLLEFRDITSESVKLFGKGAAGIASRLQALSQRLGEMGAFADIFGKSLSNITGGSAEQFNFMEKSLRSLGAGAEDVAFIAQEAVKRGVHINTILYETQKSLNEVASSSGVNQKIISKNFLILQKDIVNFGHLSAKELQQSSAELTKMGLSAQDAVSIFSKLDTFESAAQTSAMLSQSFGMNVDALKLIRAEKPEEIFEMFRDSLSQTGRSFDEMSRHEKSLMASTTGLSAASLKSLMDFRNAGMSYEESMKKMQENTPEAKQLKAYKDMSGSLKEIKNIMQDTSFFSSFFKGLRTSFVLASGLGDKFINVSKRMQDFYITALDFGKDTALMKSFRSAFKPIEDTIDALIGKGGSDKGLFDTDKLQNSVKPFFKGFSDILAKSFKKDANILDLQSEFSKKLGSAFSFEAFINSPNNPATQLFKTGGKLVGQILKGFAAIGPGILDVVDKALTGTVDFLLGYKSDQGDNSITTMLMDIFGLNNNDSMAIQETFNKLIDVLIGGSGPFMRLFTWVNQKMFGLVVDLAAIAGEAFMKSVPVLNLFTSEYTSNMQKGRQEASQQKLQGNASTIKSIASQMDEYENEKSMFGLNDDEEELARLGGQLQYVVSALEKSGSKQEKDRLKEFFDKANISKSQLLNVREMEDHVEEVMDLARFLETGSSSNFDDVEFKKSNDVWEDFASIFGSGGKAIVKTRGGKTQINQLNQNDKVMAGMKNGDIENAISQYAGEYALQVLNSLPAEYLLGPALGTSSSRSQSSVQENRPIEITIHNVMDGDVVGTKLVKANLIGKLKDPSLSSAVLRDGVTRNQAGGSNEISSLG
jgi:hypothetical protein